MQNESKEFTVTRAKVGINGQYLAGLSLEDAQAEFKHVDKRLIKEMHTEAVKKANKKTEKGTKKKK